MKRLLFIPLFIFCVLQLFAQEIKVTGKVLDGESGEPLPGVNVVIDGTQQGTVTTNEGIYEITVPSAEAALLFSFIGYLSERVEVGGRTVLDIQLIPELQSLDDRPRYEQLSLKRASPNSWVRLKSPAV